MSDDVISLKFSGISNISISSFSNLLSFSMFCDFRVDSSVLEEAEGRFGVLLCLVLYECVFNVVLS